MKTAKSGGNIIKKINNHTANNTKQSLSMYKHLKAILTVKPYLSTKLKTPGVKKKNFNNNDKFTPDELNNVKQTYTGVLSKKCIIDTGKPKTIGLGKSKFSKVPIFQEIQHQERLKALAERIKVYGTLKDRQKTKFDPIGNPVYFFRSPNDYKGIHDVELNSYKKKMDNLNKNESSQSNNIYTRLFKSKNSNSYSVFKKTFVNNLKSSTPDFLDLKKIISNTELGIKALEEITSNSPGDNNGDDNLNFDLSDKKLKHNSKQKNKKKQIFKHKFIYCIFNFF